MNQPAGRFCAHCGEAVGGAAVIGDDAAHRVCERALELEPPRYCRHCARRMKVQVTPRDWTAICVEHGAS